MHILMGAALTPREAERKGLVHETVSGKALDRAMEIAERLSSYTPESVASRASRDRTRDLGLGRIALVVLRDVVERAAFPLARPQ
jgi:enoyl-CoA hydratase/carnithine racemase